MIRRLLAAFTKQMDTGLDGASPRSVQISAGMARLVFASPVTSCESAGVSIATDTGFTSTPVTPAIGTDGSLLLFGGGITNGQVLKFTGTVTIAGASVPFDVIRATSLAEARLAVASVGMPITIISAKDVVISGTSIFFSDANTSIEFPSEVTQYPVSSPSVYLRSSGCNVVATVGGTVTINVSGAEPGVCTAVMLELDNAGSAAVTWGMTPTWAGGVAPSLTASGKDYVGLCSRGEGWAGVLVSSDAK